jgi:predicted GNAT family N-acyltransferase
MADIAEPQILVVAAADVRPLRREVLCVGMPHATVEFDGDDDAETMHLAAKDFTGEIVAVSSWMLRPMPEDPQPKAVQLRGMAIRQGLQGSGLGGILIETGLIHVRRRGVEWVWANARDSALHFYEKHGFDIIGDGFIESVTGLPHHRVRRTV